MFADVYEPGVTAVSSKSILRVPVVPEPANEVVIPVSPWKETVFPLLIVLGVALPPSADAIQV
jgi:hypothetical protein